MKRQKWLQITNPILFILILWMVISGTFHSQIPYEVFEKAHPFAGYALFLLIILHLVLNWNWVKMNYFKKKPKA
jgi:hypothetical protein